LFPFDPASAAVKLRVLVEAIAQDIATRIGINLTQPTQAELLRAVDMRLGMEAQVRQLFHLLRRTGNLAAHEIAHGNGYREGMDASRWPARSKRRSTSLCCFASKRCMGIKRPSAGGRVTKTGFVGAKVRKPFITSSACTDLRKAHKSRSAPAAPLMQ
jgi:hypothetical protein